jgi:serine acetyltransferase
MKKTERLHLQQPYLSACEAIVTEIHPEKGIATDVTIAFAEGGGQISDWGVLITDDGIQIPFTDVQKGYGRLLLIKDFPSIQIETPVYHKVALEDLEKFRIGQSLKILIDIDRRNRLCVSHTGIHLVLMGLEKIKPSIYQLIRGCHISSEKARLDFMLEDKFTDEQIIQAREYTNQIIKENWDAITYVNRDPAAKNYQYVLDSYLTFKAVLWYRVAHRLLNLDQSLITMARMISENAKSFSGIEIHLAAKFGIGLVIDHGTGVVIGETSIVGKYAYLLNGVVLGANGIADNLAGDRRHPIVGDFFECAANVKILGAVSIGNNVKVGADCRIDYDLDDYSISYCKAIIETYRDYDSVKIDSISPLKKEQVAIEGRNLKVIDECIWVNDNQEEIVVPFEQTNLGGITVLLKGLITKFNWVSVILKRKGRVIVRASSLF